MSSTTFTKEFLTGEYESFKRLAYEYDEKKQYEKALKAARFAARIAYHFPILYNFSDDELENLLLKISTGFLKKNNESAKTQNANKIVFYDTQIVDSGQLTEQFLNYFIEKKYEVLIVIPHKKNLLLGQRILKTINETPSVELFVPEDTADTERIQLIYEKVTAFSPAKAFLQINPDDVVGFCVFANLPAIERYFLDITFQSFWLGKLCADYFLEIFKVGWLIATERRKLASSKLVYLPIYPITDKNEFAGFPFDRTNKIVGLSGAQLYKYLADPELKYFNAIKDLLKENPDFVFCLAGGGMPATVIEDFTRKNQLQNRFYLLGKRKDFYELVKNSDILFESYPVKGGLTPLFAIENKISLIGIANRNNFSGGLEDLLDINTFKQGESFEEFYREANELIKSKEAREKNVALFQECKKTKYYFNKTLDDILLGKKPTTELYINQKLVYDDTKALKEYQAVENAEFNYHLEKIYFSWSALTCKNKFQTIFSLLLTIRQRSTLKLLLDYFIYALRLLKVKQ